MHRWFYPSFILMMLMMRPAYAEKTDPIKVGMTAAFSGPVAKLGRELRTGIEIYFQMVNDAGGIQHRPIRLIAYDDSYEPEQAAKNMRRLINEDNVLATIGNVGTPTAIVTMPITVENKTLMFAPFSGSEVLRSPRNRYIIHYRPGYADEIREMINGLLSNGIAPEKIAFFTQQDSYGDSIYNNAMKLLHQKGVKQPENLVHSRYTRNTENVEHAVARILEADKTPEAVIMAGSYQASAKFITLLHRYLPHLWFINVSFVGSGLLAKELDDNINHVVITQVVPLVESSLPLVRQYKLALKRYAPSKIPNDVSLEGYIIARLFHQGLRNISGEINRESIIDGLEQIHNLDIGLGSLISYDKNDHQGMTRIWPACITKGGIEPFDWKTIKKEAR